MNIPLEQNKYLHILENKGWYIDELENYDGIQLENSTIKREFSSSDFFNNPNIYAMSACNGSCKYCYQNMHIKKISPNLNLTQIKQFLSKIEPLQDKTAYKSVELFGGEPLLRKDIKDLINLLNEYGYHILIATNGTLPILQDEHFLKLCKNVHLRISLDGHTQELHEKYRSKNSFEKIINNIYALTDNNLDFSVKSIITNENFLYLYEMLDFFKNSLHVKNWNYNVLYNLQESKENMIKSNINHLTMVKELCQKKYFTYMPMFKQTPFNQMLTNVYVKHTKRYRRTYLFLNYDNQLFINDQLIVPEYCIGTVDNINKSYINFIKTIELEKESCQKCFAKDYCYLGNYGELYLKDSTLRSEFPTCDILRKCIIYLMEQQAYGPIMLKEIYSKSTERKTNDTCR